VPDEPNWTRAASKFTTQSDAATDPVLKSERDALMTNGNRDAWER
jgi:hypothetical protein